MKLHKVKFLPSVYQLKGQEGVVRWSESGNIYFVVWPWEWEGLVVNKDDIEILDSI